MAEKNPQFSMEQLASMASSPAGQALYSTLLKTNQAQLQQAMALAQAGDMAAAGQILAPLLSDRTIRQRVEQLRGR